ncbi:MFS transporter [Paenibacillus motobuensis]|uniref:MFS transporter n=1 Tax=Paenibacillus TaxID=44249 RepID=UPI00203AA278|nr:MULTISPECIES: MFS transporter [Paenibacillus]MCM3039486.1 MFS transporter [Paenibacillus lutimineralis]MCM3646590.1 MFS transporter [Paenibacillus motobuensis]
MRTFAFASYSLYFLAGLVITTIGSVMPQLLAHYEQSYTVGGQMVFVSAVGFIVGVPISAWLMKVLIKEKYVLALSAIVIAIAQFSVWSLPPFGWVVALNFLNSVGTAAIECVVATLMMEVFVGRRAVVMSYLEVSFGIGALCMPLIASVLIANQVWRYSFLVTACLGIIMAVIWCFISFTKEETGGTGSLDADIAPPPMFKTKQMKRYILFAFVFLIFIYSGIEGSLNHFMSSIFLNHLEVTPYYASLSISLFWIAMVIGRAATGWIIRKVNYASYLRWSMFGTLVVIIVFALSKDAVVGFIVVIIMGLTMSGVYSITMVYANHTLPGMTRLVTSLVTAFAGFGAAVFPALIGYSMDHSGMVSALWYMAGFAAIYLIILLLGIGRFYRNQSNVIIN